MTSLRVALKLSMAEAKPENSGRSRKKLALESTTEAFHSRKRKKVCDDNTEDKNSNDDFNNRMKHESHSASQSPSEDDSNMYEGTDSTFASNFVGNEILKDEEFLFEKKDLMPLQNTSEELQNIVETDTPHDDDDDDVSNDDIDDDDTAPLLDKTCSLVDIGVKHPRSTTQRKRARSSSGLADIDVQSNTRTQSHRASALVAKSRLAVRTASRLTPSDEAAHVAVEDVASNEKNRTAEALDWVQCDNCAKWRSITSNVHKALPDKWFCRLNTWDLRYNTCAAPEEVMVVAESNSGLKPTSTDVHSGRGGRGGRGGRWRHRFDRDAVSRAVGNVEETDLNSDDNMPPKREINQTSVTNRRKGGTIKLNNNVDVSPSVAAVNWVQCNKCKKWRKVPEFINVDRLPEKWFCSLNTWAPAFARCSAREENDEPAVSTSPNLVESVLPNDKPVRDLSARKRTTTQTGAAVSSSDPTLPAIKKVSWVQCERKNCKKWRKVPGSIDTKSFPEKWFCEMNTWDTDVATCDAPEVSDDEDDYQQAPDSRAQLILSNSKGAGTLSYRRIIFGTDGKIRSCFSDKNRNGYGIFSFLETQKQHSGDTDDYFEPIRTLSFWWSSAFDENGARVSTSQSRDVKRCQSDAQSSDCDSLHLLDQDANILLNTARRLGGLSVPIAPHMSYPKKLSKSWRKLCSMTVFNRMRAESIAVRSCFLTEPYDKTMDLIALQSKLKKCHFLVAEVEIVREFMTVDILKQTLRRLEIDNEISVSLTSVGQLCFELLPTGKMVSTSRGEDDTALSFGAKPVKLRKFFSTDALTNDVVKNSVSELSDEIPSKNLYFASKFKQYTRQKAVAI